MIHFCRPLARLWLPLARLCLPLAPFWLPLAPFWLPSGTLWVLFGARWLPLVSFLLFLVTFRFPLLSFSHPWAQFARFLIHFSNFSSFIRSFPSLFTRITKNRLETKWFLNLTSFSQFVSAPAMFLHIQFEENPHTTDSTPHRKQVSARTVTFRGPGAGICRRQLRCAPGPLKDPAERVRTVFATRCCTILHCTLPHITFSLCYLFG